MYTLNKKSLAIAAAIPVLLMGLSTSAYADSSFTNPTIGGKPIDKCLKSGVRNNCGAQRRIANAFCKIKKNTVAVNWKIQNGMFPVAVKRASTNSKGRLVFLDVLGRDTFKKIKCKSSTIEKSFKRPVVNGMRIDACVQGAGWGLWDPKRCNTQQLKRIATKYCISKGYVKAKRVTREGHIGNHSTLSFRNGYPRHSSWTQVAGTDAVEYLLCTK